MTTRYKRQLLKMPLGWEIKRNEFYDIDPLDNISDDDKFLMIYCQEDMLLLQKGLYHLDLGWYGSDNFNNPMTGFMLVLYRGQDWNNCELLELTRTRSKQDVINAIDQMIELVESNYYDNMTGYIIGETDSEFRHIGHHLRFSVRENIDQSRE